MSATKRVQQWSTFSRMWYLYDAQWQDPFLSAKVLSPYLTGQNKPIYHPLNDCGDHVVVINSREIALRGDEWKKRVYFHHTGYPRGASWTLAWELHQKDPKMIMRKAVYKAIASNLVRRTCIERLHIYPGSEIPEEIKSNLSGQIRPIMPVPKRLQEYSKEEIDNYPKVFEFPNDYVLR
ncbi:large ribosomal subunit protein uL13m-like [Daphnia carinata]|uniref:large ribosomal subunit protein uL13m-like n=1 Tax=Daphnia carinata TaxID=120202 RepID=UPI00257B4F27|nr:large ribosomal subunit protein uL13m-like [Daphnia carinata]